MKFRLELLIHKPRTDVWTAFDNPANMKLWQPTLVDFETVQGRQGQPGAVSHLTYRQGEREFKLVETITHREEPKRFDGRYENEFAINTIHNSFVEQAANQTLWVVETDFTFKTLIMKLLGPLMKKSFVSRTEGDMQRFKEMMEGQ